MEAIAGLSAVALIGVALIALKIRCCNTFLSAFVYESCQEVHTNEGFYFLVGDTIITLWKHSVFWGFGSPLLLSNATEGDPQLSVQHYKQTRNCSVFTILSMSSLMSIMPHENFWGLTVGNLDMYFQLYFLRSLNGFDVFIKNHICKADICMSVLLDCDKWHVSLLLTRN